MLTKQGLIRIKYKALRHRVWYKVLSRVERSIIDLTIRCVERVRSPALIKTILEITDRLFKTLKDDYLQRTEKIGRKVAENVSKIALRWGNNQAWSWGSDLRFVRFLGMIALNI